MDANQQILEAIEYGIEQKLKKKKQNDTQIYVGIVTSVIENRKYKIRYDEKEKIFTLKHDLGLKVQDKVHICYPCGDSNEKFILEDL